MSTDEHDHADIDQCRVDPTTLRVQQKNVEMILAQSRFKEISEF